MTETCPECGQTLPVGYIRPAGAQLPPMEEGVCPECRQPLGGKKGEHKPMDAVAGAGIKMD